MKSSQRKHLAFRVSQGSGNHRVRGRPRPSGAAEHHHLISAASHAVQSKENGPMRQCFFYQGATVLDKLDPAANRDPGTCIRRLAAKKLCARRRASWDISGWCCNKLQSTSVQRTSIWGEKTRSKHPQPVAGILPTRVLSLLASSGRQLESPTVSSLCGLDHRVGCVVR